MNLRHPFSVYVVASLQSDRESVDIHHNIILEQKKESSSSRMSLQELCTCKHGGQFERSVPKHLLMADFLVLEHTINIP